MRVAIIDLGTNSVRFDVHQLGPGKTIRRLHREKLMVRLGQGVFTDARLDPAAVRRTLQAFASFQQTARDLQADKVVAFGTSALREAADSDKFLDLIRTRTGIDVRVISGVEEAKLIAQGILENEKSIKGKERFALVDIGGGSTEISVCRNKQILLSESFPFGVARLQQVFLKSSPPKPNEVDELRRYIRGTLLSKIITDEWPKVNRIYGSSGTIRALARLVKKSKGGQEIDLSELKKSVKQISTMTTTQLLGIPKMEAKRVDMIVAGGILFEEVMSALKVKKAFMTEYSLRDGIFIESRNLFQQHRSSSIAFHLPDLYAKAKRLGANENHIKQVVLLVETLFDRLRPLHKLKPDWRLYLTAAAILHDTGEAIGPTKHEQHSYYVVKNADFPSMEKWESEFVAMLCLYHKSGKITPGDLPFKDKSRRDAFLKLLSILRIADALDRGHKSNVRIKRIRIARKQVVMGVSGRSAVDLELLRIEQKKALFEQVFGRDLVAEKV